jgi:hypothetical protein
MVGLGWFIRAPEQDLGIHNESWGEELNEKQEAQEKLGIYLCVKQVLVAWLVGWWS